ncbi:CoA-acylating methylmalonate-semialdehyde dehydrogenase [Pendulispora albinea]|uniref:methylmalonate-semialdehyde dehydrogenase (CoA acylating) n=1 Tax=Pendulispora albinea TaxID=2741071 RepID=A0ABZ2LY56_9BACT
MDVIKHWIDNKAVDGGDRNGDVFNPATGEKTAKVVYATREDVDRAVASAKKALESWGKTSLAKRTRVLFAYRELVERNKDEIARMLTLEHGKVLSDAAGEVQRGLEVIEFACGISELSKGEFSENVSTEVDSYSLRQPVGVCAGITPFNFPAMVPMWMYPIAIACGNTFVLKPSEKDPSVTNFCARLLQEAGLPEGVLNIVHGDKVAVDRLLEHPDVGAISFVGSTPIAKYIYETGTRHGKRVQALGGAKNHMVVLPDADMDLAADAAVSAGYGSAGERCMAISVLVTVGDAAEKLLPKMRERMAALKVGPGLDPSSEMGPLVTKQHMEKVASYVAKGVAEGAKLLDDGRTLKVKGHENGFFLGPSLFDDVRPEMTIYQEEIFGPVLSVVRVPTYADAVKLIHEHVFANGVALFTNDGGVARKFQSDIQVGMVGINVPIPVPMAYYSFGGWKSSLFGDLHIYGRDGVRFYTRNKVVIARWPDPRFRGVNLGFPQNS